MSGSPSAPDPLRAQFARGVRLAERGRRDQALAEFVGCLQLAAARAIPLTVEQVAGLLQEIAWCHGDSGRWDAALAIYAQIERVLRQAPGWQAGLPAGLVVQAPPGYDAAPALVALRESLAIAHDARGETERAAALYAEALAGYAALGDQPKQATVWQHMAMGCQRRQDWAGLRHAALQMLDHWTAVAGSYGQVWAWQYLAQAAANSGDLAAAIGWLEQAVAAERKLAHKDLAHDAALLDRLRAATRPRGLRGLLARMAGHSGRNPDDGAQLRAADDQGGRPAHHGEETP